MVRMDSRMSRRVFMSPPAPSGAAAASGSPALAKTRSLRIVNLAVDGVSQPLGLQNPRPLLSWRIASAARGVMQGGYQITVASTLKRLQAGEADVWDSGKVASDQSFAIKYAGPELASRTRVFWRVSQSGTSTAGLPTPSAASWWEMGLLKPDDWTATWLAASDAETLADQQAGFSWIWGDPAGQGRVQRQFRASASTCPPHRRRIPA